MIDLVALGILLVFAVIGYFKGFVTQAMSIAGFVTVYFFSRSFGEVLEPTVIGFLGSAKGYAMAVAILWAAILIYLGVWLVGLFIEKFIVKPNDSLKSMSRFSGGALGAVKGLCVVLVIFYLLYLVPQDFLNRTAPKVTSSVGYRLIDKLPVLDRNEFSAMFSKASAPILSRTNAISKKQEKQIQRIESDMNENKLLEVLSSEAKPLAKR